MLPLLVFVQNFITDSAERVKGEAKGATAVEYGLLVGLIAVAIIAVLVLLGDDLNSLFTKVTNKI